MHGRIQFVSWNARALLQRGGARAQSKLNYLRKLDLPRSVLCLQEVHADRGQLVHFVAKVSPGSI
eukprot:6849355-Pyramimonas_sp.AAC.1